MQRHMMIIASAVLALLPTATRAGAPQYATPTFLLPYAESANFIDYRPAINAAGTRIVFERQLQNPNEQTYSQNVNLYISDLKDPKPTRLVPSLQGTTRADWCWSTPLVDGPITFAAVAPPKNAPQSVKSTYFLQPGIYYTTTQPQAGGSFAYVPNTTEDMTYPTWFPGCSNLAVYTSNEIPYLTKRGPETIKFDLAGNQLRSLSGKKLWAGFPSVNQRTPHLLALAAQQFNANGYNEDLNYIYIADEAGTPPRVVPLDPKAPRNRYNPRFEGRAPTWSPDGQWIAFESDRNCALPTSSPYYAIFIQDAQGKQPARQVTDCGYDAQHAKWYRQPVNNRNLLITTVRLHPTYTGTDVLLLNGRGIAALDVTPFLHH